MPGFLGIFSFTSRGYAGVTAMAERNRNRILCVDDESDACEVLAATLPLLTFTFAHSFSAGVELIRSSIFELYLFDEFLPGPSGIDLCREVRKLDMTTPILLLSPAGRPGNRCAAYAAGVSAYLDLPTEFIKLESTVIGLILQAEAKSLEARCAELAAINAEMNDYLAQIDRRKRKNSQAILRATEHLLKATAYSTFIEAGGARSHFEHLWQDVMGEVLEP